MTPMLMLTDITPVAAASTKTADDVLRDVAFVLRMTRRVRDDILADVPMRTAHRATCVQPVAVGA